MLAWKRGTCRYYLGPQGAFQQLVQDVETVSLQLCDVPLPVKLQDFGLCQNRLAQCQGKGALLLANSRADEAWRHPRQLCCNYDHLRKLEGGRSELDIDACTVPTCELHIHLLLDALFERGIKPT